MVECLIEAIGPVIGHGNFKVVPPETGIVHQVNCEYLARILPTN